MAIIEESIERTVQDWAQGRVVLKEIRGYSSQELYSIAHIGYYFIMQGRYEEARTIFEGLIAVDPKNEYYYRALGVVFENLGDHERALRQFGYAIRLSPAMPHAYLNRAEVLILLNRFAAAREDLQSVLDRVNGSDLHLSRKAWALFKFASAEK